jgi:hypothetical protein
LFLLLVSAALAPRAPAWDYEGHRLVNEIALASLPADFPAFAREPAAAERIAWLGSEPDRWRSSPDRPIRHANAADHYLDMEQLEMAGLTLERASSLRYQFALQFAAGRAMHPERFPPIDHKKNDDHTREWPGFLPWAITEYFGKLRGDFARLKVLEGEKLGTPEEIAQTKASIVELMGMMGHFVGDGSQPLHTTNSHNGWVGSNPKRYTTWRGLHAWIDGGFIAKAGITFADVHDRVASVEAITLPAPKGERDPMFDEVLKYLQMQHAFVEPLYELEKKGVFKVNVAAKSAEGREFIVRRLLTGGHMLGRIWLTAWRSAPPDAYLRAQLLEKRGAPADEVDDP